VRAVPAVRRDVRGSGAGPTPASCVLGAGPTPAPAHAAGPATWDFGQAPDVRESLVELLADALAAAVDPPSDKSPRGLARTAAPGGPLEPPSRLSPAVPGPTAAPAASIRLPGARVTTLPASTRRGDGVGDPVGKRA